MPTLGGRRFPSVQQMLRSCFNAGNKTAQAIKRLFKVRGCGQPGNAITCSGVVATHQPQVWRGLHVHRETVVHVEVLAFIHCSWSHLVRGCWEEYVWVQG